MRLFAFILGALGLLAVLMGTLSIFGAMPAMIAVIEPLGLEATAASFWWVLATLLFLASLAFSAVAREIRP